MSHIRERQFLHAYSTINDNTLKLLCILCTFLRSTEDCGVRAELMLTPGLGAHGQLRVRQCWQLMASSFSSLQGISQWWSLCVPIKQTNEILLSQYCLFDALNWMRATAKETCMYACVILIIGKYWVTSSVLRHTLQLILAMMYRHFSTTAGDTDPLFGFRWKSPTT